MNWQQCVIVVFLIVRVLVAVYDLAKRNRTSGIINLAGTVLLYAALKTGGFWG